MFNPTQHTDSPTRSLAAGDGGLRRSNRSRRAASAAMFIGTALLATLGATTAAQAQMVPRAEHALRQNTGNGNYTTVRIDLHTEDGEDNHGRGLALRGQGFWPHWEGRVGVVIDRPINPLKDSFVLAQPNQGSGLRVRSMHILSDYYVEGGFRATAGLVQGSAGQSWWSSGGTGGGLNLSIQRLDNLGVAGSSASAQSELQTSPYVGAGYSNSLTVNGGPSPWRFNADLGLISVNSGNINRIGQVFQGDRSLDDLVRELRLRPILKVSVGYSF